MKFDFKKLLPHIIAVLVFLIVAVVLCKPALEGKVVYQHDLQGWRGMVQQSIEFKQAYGHYPLWTNSLFSGMPAYQIALDATHKLSLGYLETVFTLGLPQPISFFFLACISLYFLSIVLRVNPYLGILAGLAYAYSTYDPVIIMVGHVTKMASMAYAPAVLASLLLLLQKKYWTGSALLMMFSFLMISQNHVQIVYYTLLIALAIAIAYAVKAIKAKEGKHLVIAGVLAIVSGIVGLGGAAITLMPTAEYAKETMRGGRSELTDSANAHNKTAGGLDKDYAFNWSYGVDETLTLLVPDIYGGSSSGELDGSSKTAEVLTDIYGPDNAAQVASSLPAYWGPQPSTSGPVYLGAIICFLFVLGLVYLDTWHKWWIAGVTLFAIMLAWGSNFKAFNYFMFDVLPVYNKFRAPTMALVIPQLTAALMAALVLQKFLFGGEAKELLLKKLKLSVYITAGVLALTTILYLSFSYTGENDRRLQTSLTANFAQAQPNNPQAEVQAQQMSKTIISALAQDRKSLFGADLLRSFLFILAAVVVLWLFVKAKINALTATILLVALTVFDLLPVGKRYLNETNFVEKTNIEDEFAMTDADRMIMADPDHKNFRIFNTDDPYNNAKPSYYHNSVGGYNPAKLAIYQDLIEHQLSKGNMSVFNMLNTKYFVMQDPRTGKPTAQQNPEALGNVWLVKGIRFVPNADAEMGALDSLNVRDSAVIDVRYKAKVATMPVFDSSASIKLLENINDTVRYTYNAATPQFAVFSEIYYDKGWNAYLDGNKADYMRTNYVLRGMSLPAGKHNIEFRFEPASYKRGNQIALWSTIIAILTLLAAVVMDVRKKKIV